MKRNLLSLAVGLGLAMAASAQAQIAPPADEDETKSETTLDEVTVTARRREETLQDVPVAVTAFTPETIEKLNIRDLGDLDAQVPNLTI
jgi:iron complex outermembrane receptor protein